MASTIPITGVKASMDDCIRALMVLSDGAEKQFLEFVEQLEVWLTERVVHKKELVRLQTELIKSQSEVTRLEKLLKNAQHMFGMEKEKRIAAQRQVQQIHQMMESFKMSNHKSGTATSRVDDSHHDQLLSQLSLTLEQGNILGALTAPDGRHLGSSRAGGESPAVALSTIDEHGDTLDAVSDIDLTEGDDLDNSSILLRSDNSFNKDEVTPATVRKRRSSGRKRVSAPDEDHDHNRRKVPRHAQQTEVKLSSGGLYPDLPPVYPPTAPPLSAADEWVTTPTAPKRLAPQPPTPQIGTPTSQFSTPPQSSPLLRSHLSASRVQRPHCFTTKMMYMSEYCQPCGKRIKFGKQVLKCRDCRAVCHPECRSAVPLPCVPTACTPGSKQSSVSHHCTSMMWHSSVSHYCTSMMWQSSGSIADYTPAVSPMVPSLIVHCSMEIERRGFTELGLYRVSVLERDVRALKEKFLRGKGVPCLNNVDVHVMCNAVKDFLRCLKEPLITHSLWQEFVSSANKRDEADWEAALYQCIAELPQPNRDTLAWMILHLQRVGEAKECKMPTANLAKVFGPTLVGYSVSDPEPHMILQQTSDQQIVMNKLLEISRDYWETFISITDENMFCGQTNVDFGHIKTPDTGRSNRRKSIITRTPLIRGVSAH
ncbi:Protein kinase C-like phorbol ester/diacylglycerol-binding domain [Trinorchestia longiramus]|nr:Protein kinase C-like phorbol ester/diacylglycerol-binding domain [Trinorchestia longiramus]